MNYLEIAGIVSHLPTERELASGIKTLSWRMKVPREVSGSDSIPCSLNIDTAAKNILNKALSLDVGNHIEITGELRSRYWQGSEGGSSRIEVEVHSIRKISNKKQK